MYMYLHVHVLGFAYTSHTRHYRQLKLPIPTCTFRPCQLSCLGSSVGRASVQSTECCGFESHLRQLSFSFFHCLRCLSFFLSTSPITSCTSTCTMYTYHFSSTCTCTLYMFMCIYMYTYTF